MSSDQSSVQPPQGLRIVAYRSARNWAAEHGHQQPDDRMVDAVLAALFDACEVRQEVLWHGPAGEREFWVIGPLPAGDGFGSVTAGRLTITTPPESVSPSRSDSS